MRIFKNAWFERFARKQCITDRALHDAIERAEKGLIDADLGGGVIKQRVARQGQGKIRWIQNHCPVQNHRTGIFHLRFFKK